MSNPNMSYCAFENTADSLQQLITMVREAYNEGMSFGDFQRSRSSKYEAQAVRDVLYLCQDLIDSFGALDQNVVDDEEE